MNTSEILDFLLPQWSDPLQIIFLNIILAMMLLTIVTTHYYAKQSSWEKKWNGNTSNNHGDDLDIDHGSVTDIWNAVATAPEKLAEVMPGLLLVVGLLGTFLGLGLALNHASTILVQPNALTSSGAANSMQELLGLLEGLGTKFKTSTWGITGFLLLKVWSSVTRFEEKRLTWVIRKVKKELEARKQLAQNAEKSKQDIGVAKQDALMRQIERAAGLIAQVFVKQMNELKEHDKVLHTHNIHIIEKNSQSLRENLTAISNSVLDGNAAIKWIVDKNVGDIRNDLNSIKTATDANSEAIQHFVGSTQTIINGMSEAGASMGKGANEIGQAAIGMKAGASEIGKAANELVGAVGDFKNEFTTVLNGVRIDLGSAINNMSEQASKTLENGSKELKNATTSIADALGGLSESMQKTMNDLQKSITDVQIVQQRSAERFNQSNIALTEQSIENKLLIENLGKNITDGMSAISDSIEKMDGIGRSLKTLVPKLILLESLPSVLQPLVELPNYNQSLLKEVGGIRQDFSKREPNFQSIENIRFDISEKLIPALQSLLVLPSQQESLRNEILELQKNLRLFMGSGVVKMGRGSE